MPRKPTYLDRRKAHFGIKEPKRKRYASDKLKSTNAWKKASKAFRKRFPLCADCKGAGRTQASEMVHHIIPHNGDLVLFWNPLNWMALCNVCHAKRHPEKGRCST